MTKVNCSRGLNWTVGAGQVSKRTLQRLKVYGLFVRSDIMQKTVHFHNSFESKNKVPREFIYYQVIFYQFFIMSL